MRFVLLLCLLDLVRPQLGHPEMRSSLSQAGERHLRKTRELITVEHEDNYILERMIEAETTSLPVAAPVAVPVSTPYPVSFPTAIPAA